MPRNTLGPALNILLKLMSMVSFMVLVSESGLELVIASTVLNFKYCMAFGSLAPSLVRVLSQWHGAAAKLIKT